MATIKYWNGTAWELAIVGKQGPAGPTGPTGPAGQATMQRYRFTAAGGETSESGPDDNGNTLAYTVGLEEVFLNGVLLVRNQDYTASNGTSITGLEALVAGDVVEVLAWGVFNVSNTISTTLIDAKADLLVGTAADTVGRLAVGANNTVLTADSSTATGLRWATPSAAAFVGCSLYKSGNQSISDSTYTAATFDLEFFDTDSFHNTSTNTSRITIPSGKGGKYLFVATADFTASSTGIRQIGFWKNGSIQRGQVAVSATSAGESKVTVTGIYDLVATDYVEFNVYQNSGQVRNLLSDGTIFSCQYLGA